LLDNENLVNHLSESDKLTNIVKKFEANSKTIRKKFEELQAQFSNVSVKVANL